MRPEVLWPLFQSIETLSGVGKKTAERLCQRIGPTIRDLCFYLPHQLQYRTYLETPRIVNGLSTLLVNIGTHTKIGRRYQVTCFADSISVQLVFFHAKGEYIIRQLPEGEWRLVSGRLEMFNGDFQIVHPEISLTEKKKDYVGYAPIYGLVSGLHQRTFQAIMSQGLHCVPILGEWIEKETMDRWQWPSFRDALIQAHHPNDADALTHQSPARMRLAYDEVLADQLAMALVRRYHCQRPGSTMEIDLDFMTSIRDALPFTLTMGQEAVLQDVLGDMEAPHRMLRLLMGDVGSGKTVIAFLAMLNAVQNGHQAVFLAPTEILARQQYEKLQSLVTPFGMDVGLFTGQQHHRQKLRKKLASGEIQLAVGTHALLEEAVIFKDLRFAAIDEQHRFGVEQRLQLMSKGVYVDLLVMSATPIPRTLLLTLYSELKISVLNEKPKGRLDIVTRVLPLSRVHDVQNGLVRVLERAEQVYWVCPLIEESELLHLGPATKRFEILDKLFPGKVALIHGRMKADKKNRIMNSFFCGKLLVLVSTTVIEVGMDVPAATVMIVEHAERFGLAQLHQLRGRVGRGTLSSACVLLYGQGVSKTGIARLHLMRETLDGFKIAEEDLKLRGGGDILGTKQSGMPDYVFANPYDVSLMQAASEEVITFLAKDPDLTSLRGQALRCLLHLFGQDRSMTYLSSG